MLNSLLIYLSEKKIVKYYRAFFYIYIVYRWPYGFVEFVSNMMVFIVYLYKYILNDCVFRSFVVDGNDCIVTENYSYEFRLLAKLCNLVDLCIFVNFCTQNPRIYFVHKLYIIKSWSYNSSFFVCVFFFCNFVHIQFLY